MLDPSTAAAIAWKTSLLLAAIGLIAWLTAKQSAAWRHFLWTCALTLSLLMPIAVVSLPSYVQVDAGVAHAFELGAFGKLNARFTIINVFDKVYEIRDGTGVGVGAPQFGPRRAYYIAFEKPFKL